MSLMSESQNANKIRHSVEVGRRLLLIEQPPSVRMRKNRGKRVANRDAVVQFGRLDLFVNVNVRCSALFRGFTSSQLYSGYFDLLLEQTCLRIL